MASFVEQLLNSETLRKIRFGGILGKLTLVAVVALIGAVLEVRFATDWHVQLACICMAGMIVVGVLIIVAIYSLKHPQHATLEGAEVIAFTQLQMATKNNPEITRTSTRKLNDLTAGKLIGGRTVKE